MLQTPLLRRIALIAGTMLAVTSMALSLEYGLQVHLGFAMACVTVSFLASYVLPMLWEVSKVSPMTARVGIAVAAMIIGGDIVQNASTLGVHRVTDVQTATVQQTRFDDARAKVTENRENLAMWKAQLAKLTSENAWSATVKADGLRAQLDAASLAIEQESKRGGCGPRCLSLTREKGDLENRIATVELREDLTKRIEATQRLVDGYREAAANTEAGSSAIATQNLKLASIMTLTRAPTEGAQWWTDTWLMVVFGALITIASCFFNLISLADSSLMQRFTGTAAPTLHAEHQTPARAPQDPDNYFVRIGEDTLRRWAQSPEVKKLHAA